MCDTRTLYAHVSFAIVLSNYHLSAYSDDFELYDASRSPSNAHSRPLTPHRPPSHRQTFTTSPPPPQPQQPLPERPPTPNSVRFAEKQQRERDREVTTPLVSQRSDSLSRAGNRGSIEWEGGPTARQRTVGVQKRVSKTVGVQCDDLPMPHMMHEGRNTQMNAITRKVGVYIAICLCGHQIPSPLIARPFLILAFLLPSSPLLTCTSRLHLRPISCRLCSRLPHPTPQTAPSISRGPPRTSSDRLGKNSRVWRRRDEEKRQRRGEGRWTLRQTLGWGGGASRMIVLLLLLLLLLQLLMIRVRCHPHNSQE